MSVLPKNVIRKLIRKVYSIHEYIIVPTIIPFLALLGLIRLKCGFLFILRPSDAQNIHVDLSHDIR